MNRFRFLFLALTCAALAIPGCGGDKDDSDPIAVDPGPEPGPDPAPEPVPQPEPQPNPGPGWIVQLDAGLPAFAILSAVDVDHVWAGAGTFGIWRSTNGGSAWTRVFDTGPLVFQFVDPLNGWARYGPHLMSSTSDGGATWIHRLSLGSEYSSAMTFISATTGWVATESKHLYKTTDGGLNWSQQDVGVVLYGLKFITDQIGWGLGLRSILKTTDGGATWSEQHVESDSTVQFRDLSVVSPNHAWVVGNREGGLWGNALVLATTDGGAEWTEQDIDGAGIKGAYFIDYQNGWAVGANEIHHTTNGGASWSLQATPDLGPELFSGFFDVVFVNSTTGWIVGDNGIILKTTSGGD